MPPAQLTDTGKVSTYAPAFTVNKVNPNALEVGALLNVIVAAPLNVLLKLLAVEQSIVTLPPNPKSL